MKSSLGELWYFDTSVNESNNSTEEVIEVNIYISGQKKSILYTERMFVLCQYVTSQTPNKKIAKEILEGPEVQKLFSIGVISTQSACVALYLVQPPLRSHVR